MLRVLQLSGGVDNHLSPVKGLLRDARTRNLSVAVASVFLVRNFVTSILSISTRPVDRNCAEPCDCIDKLPSTKTSAEPTYADISEEADKSTSTVVREADSAAAAERSPVATSKAAVANVTSSAVASSDPLA